VIGAKWDEIDIDGKTWMVPAGRMKGGKKHSVPLSKRAMALLRELPREAGNDHVFLGSRSGFGLSDTIMMRELWRLGHDDITVHGFRSTFMDWAHEQTAFPKVTIDMALAHTVGDKVEAAYRRGDLLQKRRQLAEAWARYCTSPPAEGAVVPLRGKVGALRGKAAADA